MRTLDRYKPVLSFLLKLLVLGLTVYYLYEALVLVPDNTQSLWQQLLSLLRGDELLLVALPLALVPVNWGLEAQKWSVLARLIEPMPLGRALQAVLAGVTLGLITPNRLGDYAARMLLLESGHRFKAIGAVFLGRMCQMHSTVFFGSLGILYFISIRMLPEYPYVVAGAWLTLLFINCLFTLFLYQTRLLLPFIGSIRWMRPVLPALWVLQRYRPRVISHVLLLSGLRYLVFTLQFVLLIYAVNIYVSITAAFAGASSTLLIKSLLPSFSFLSDIGVRELSAIHFFGLLGQEEPKVLAASISLWLINIAVPALAGLLFVLRLRFFSSR